MGRGKGPEEKDFLFGYPKIKKDEGKMTLWLRGGEKERMHGYSVCRSHVGLDLVETGEPAETVVRLPEVVEQKIPGYLKLIEEELVVATLDCSGLLLCR
uniref:Uncharacterized protein n=1 Tax=Tanacetum cinerariifolium TaxID=118510 RepID=A0A6L2MVB3_TANCI|nr:hypothetical protein [Tanacetum cinerariifolium]